MGQSQSIKTAFFGKSYPKSFRLSLSRALLEESGYLVRSLSWYLWNEDPFSDLENLFSDLGTRKTDLQDRKTDSESLKILKAPWLVG